MIATAIFLLLALFAVLFFLGTARGRSSSVRGLSDLPGRTRPVDIAAYRNLVDPAEEEYLRLRLPSREFRRIQRERLRAAREYVQCTAANAAVLLRLGEATRLSAEPAIAQAGQDLVNQALRLRLYASVAEATLLLGILIPGLHISATGISDSYENLTGLVSRLGRLQQFPHTARVAASL
jgi:hypothetical protein